MMHICIECRKTRDCRCGECGEPKMETCVECNNKKVLKFAQEYRIPLNELGLGPLGSYFIHGEHLERWNEWVRKNESKI